MNGFKPNPNDIIKKLAIFKTSVSEFGVLKLILIIEDYRWIWEMVVIVKDVSVQIVHLS